MSFEANGFLKDWHLGAARLLGHESMGKELFPVAWREPPGLPDQRNGPHWFFVPDAQLSVRPVAERQRPGNF